MSSASAGQFVTPLAGVLPHVLVPPTSVPAAATVADLLPASLGEYFGFECLLGPVAEGVSPPGADFLVGVRHHDRAALAAATGPGPVWARVRRFAELWAQPDSALTDRVDNVWLEFDTGSTADGSTLAPSVFFGTDNLGPGAAAPADPGWLIEVALPLLSAGALPTAEAAALLRFLDELPPSASVYQVGRMLGRPGGATRLCLTGIEPHHLPDWFAAVGLGRRPDVAQLLACYGGLVDRIDVDVDLTERVGSRIGLECYFLPRRDPGAEPRWSRLIDLLVAERLCTDEQKAGLFAACGWDADDGTRAWPRPLRMLRQLTGGRSVGLRSRHLHHIKISTEPARPPSAKAYLEIAHHRVARTTLTPQDESTAR